MRRAVFPVLATVLVWTACSAPPPPGQLGPPVDLPDRWGWEIPEGPVAGPWWTRSTEPELAALIEEAFRSNHDLAAAASRVEAAGAQASLVGADRFPTLDLTAGRDRRRQNFIGLPIPGSGGVITSTNTSYSASLSSSWEIDLWGRVRAGAQAGAADAEAATADYAGAQLSLAAQVSRSWYAVTAARLQAELAAATVRSYEESAEQVRLRFEKGTRTSLDLRLALSQLASARALREQREATYGAAVRQLEILVGRYPERELRGADDLLPPVAGVPASLPAELLARRPDLIAAERRWVAADRRAAQARRGLLPRISLTASGGRSSSELGDLLDGDFTVWSFLTNLFQPLFQGGRLRANVSLSDALADQLAAQFANATLRALAEVETLLEGDERLREQERHLAEAAAQSTAARELAEQRYRSGLVDYVSVLDAQRSELTARSQLIAVRSGRLQNRVDLHVALGGGFTDAGEVLGTRLDRQSD